jgi:hypothetical protein
MGESFRFFISQCSNTGAPAVVNAPKSGVEHKNKPAVVGPPKLELGKQCSEKERNIYMNLDKIDSHHRAN